jgi:creatinine amidohydrolase
MQWENLTGNEFAEAVKTTGGVCVMGMGVLERHATHMPLGTDYLVSHRIAALAAEREPAVAFPPFYFGQIFEARCFPGTITIHPHLLLELIQGVFDEIGRNGFRKIVVHNGHGGNWHLLKYLAQASLWEQKPYTVYIQEKWLTPALQEKWNALLETKHHGHACECETSYTMHQFPDLVKMDKVPADPATGLGRNAHLPGNFSGIGWYAGYPEHYSGDARPASAEKGRALEALLVESLAGFIAAVKADEVLPALEKEFFERVGEVDGR